jgi:hypothetical protein
MSLSTISIRNSKIKLPIIFDFFLQRVRKYAEYLYLSSLKISSVVPNLFISLDPDVPSLCAFLGLMKYFSANSILVYRCSLLQ